MTLDGVVLAVPLGTPPEVTAGGSHAFVHTQRDVVSPVAFDPCREVEFVVNDTAAPPGAEGVVEDAVAAVSAATGPVFVHRGTTDAVPVPSPVLLAPRREPVLIAWTTPQHVPELAGSVAGIGGSSVEQRYLSGRRQYLTGMVALDATQLAGLLGEPSGTAVVLPVVMHELAHAVGLDHVDDPGELNRPRRCSRRHGDDPDGQRWMVRSGRRPRRPRAARPGAPSPRRTVPRS